MELISVDLVVDVPESLPKVYVDSLAAAPDRLSTC